MLIAALCLTMGAALVVLADGLFERLEGHR